MARGLLVTYSGYPYCLSSLFPDNGLASLAAVLRRAGHECEVLDLNTTAIPARLIDGADRAALREVLLAGDLSAAVAGRLAAISARVEERQAALIRELGLELAARCRRQAIDFVGFKLWNGDGYEAAVQLAGQLREACPGVKLFAGGPAVQYARGVDPADAARFDAVIDGDGEEPILLLAEHAEGRRGLEGIPGLVRPGASAPATATPTGDLAHLPAPDYSREAYPSVHDGSKLRLFCVDESRGCPMRCSFCINWHTEGARWRARRPDQVLAELRGFLALGSRAFRLAGTYSPPALVRSICEEINAAGLDLSFGLFLHASGVDRELASLLKSAGCFGVFLGIESGSEELRRTAMDKKLSQARLTRGLAALREAGLFVAGSFIFPAPFETAASEAETRALISEHFEGQPGSVNLAFPILLPRTTWWEERARFGFELEVDEATYVSRTLRCKVRHLLPPSLWERLPYRLGGEPQPALAGRAEALQRWVRSRGVAVNLPDHDAQLGALLGKTPAELAAQLRAIFFTGDAEGLQQLVDDANAAAAPRGHAS